MPAISPHSTEVVDRAWDGPANEARARSGESESYYRRIYAWRDPDGDPETKDAWRFIHHHVGEGGEPGAANLRACITGIAVLNGARGGTTIPDADRRGVYNHLARHIRDAGEEPPALRSAVEYERRSFAVEVRADEADGRNRIVGHAAVFGQLSEVLAWGFREQVAKGAFAKTLKESDVRSLWNHNPDYVLGRTKSGTLRLHEDDVGLAVEIDPPNTQWARDLMESIRRGDVDQMSFGFQVVREDWGEEQGVPVRTLREVRLFDVSPVTFPAYPQTDVQVRTAIEELRASIEALRSYLPAAPDQGVHPAEAEDARPQGRLVLRRKRLEVAERV